MKILFANAAYDVQDCSSYRITLLPVATIEVAAHMKQRRNRNHEDPH